MSNSTIPYIKVEKNLKFEGEFMANKGRFMIICKALTNPQSICKDEALKVTGNKKKSLQD